MAVVEAKPWFRSAWWDTTFLSFVWVPYYIWIASGPLAHPHVTPEWMKAFYQAAVVHAAATFMHRYYVFIMVYGDKEVFARRRSAYIITPIAVLPLCFVLVLYPKWFAIAYVIDRVWGLWHGVMQKYGIWRVYAAKAGGGLETRAHARRDQIFLLSQYAAVIVLVLGWRRETLAFAPFVTQFLEWVTPIVTSFWGRVCSFAILGAVLAVSVNWAVHELRAQKNGLSIPRWSFLSSILLLYVVSIVNGPVVGQLVFGTSHALEYIAFTHHFGERKYGRPDAPASVARTFLRSLRWAPIVIAGFATMYVFIHPYEGLPALASLTLTAGALHYLYDGWIWKVRDPRVAKPLGVGASESAVGAT